MSLFSLGLQSETSLFQNSNVTVGKDVTEYKKPRTFILRYGGSTGFFRGGYLPSLNINYVGVGRDTEKTLPQLYYIKMKLSYDLGFPAIGVAIAT